MIYTVELIEASNALDYVPVAFTASVDISSLWPTPVEWFDYFNHGGHRKNHYTIPVPPLTKAGLVRWLREQVA